MIHISDILKDISTTNLSLYMNNDPVVDYIKTSNFDIKFFVEEGLDDDVVSLEELISYIELEDMGDAMIPGKEFSLDKSRLNLK